MEDCGVWIVWEGSGSLIAASQQELKCLPRYPLASSPPPRNPNIVPLAFPRVDICHDQRLRNFFLATGFFSSENNAKFMLFMQFYVFLWVFVLRKRRDFFFIIYVIFMQIHVIYTILCVNRLLLRISKCGIFHFFLLIFFASKTAVAEFLYKYKIWPFLEPITQFNP